MGADLPFDARPIQGTTTADLDLRVIEAELLPLLQPPEVLAGNGRTLDQRLAALRFCGLDGTPTTAGMLVAGRYPTMWLPGAYVQFLRVDGEDLTEPVKSEKRIDGTLFEILARLDELLALHISTAVDFTSHDREVRTPDYPLAALAQAVRNAIAHRSYEHNSPIRITWFSDRVEIMNPGGPYGTVNVENFGTGVTDYRNPTLTEAMRRLGYIRCCGAGIPAIRRTLADNDNPEPMFQVTTSHVAMTIWPRR